MGAGSGADIGFAGVGIETVGGALGRGTLDIDALGSGVAAAGRAAAGVGRAATRGGGSDGVRNDTVD